MRGLAVGTALALLAGAAPGAARSRFEATITRTAHGIPHIVARDWRGLGYGVGYAHAQDDFCLLAEEFVTLAGERSLHFGPANKAVLGFEPIDNLSSDLFHRAVIDLPALRRGAGRQGREAISPLGKRGRAIGRWAFAGPSAALP